MARPKKTTEDLPNDWQKKAIKLYTEGASDVEIRADALGGISDDLWYRLIEQDIEFSRIIKKGKLLSQSWWEKQGRENLTSKEFNHVLWYMNIKNRFRNDWNERQEITLQKAEGVQFVE